MPPDVEPVTVQDFARWKAAKRPISMLTAYDASMARLFDEAGVDSLLVGDSLGTVVQGHPTTLPVTLDQMVYHAEIVARSSRRALVVADLPFLSYQASVEQAMLSAGRFLKEARCTAVKLEGGQRSAATIEALVQAGIPVVGHVGLTPQSVKAFGGFLVQRNSDALMADALAVADAGAFALVIEAVPADLARRITDEVRIPTIGIGAGPGCDGQVLVAHDMLGLFEDFRPKFVRRYAELGRQIRDAAKAYVADVASGAFPSDAESYHR